MAANQGAMDYEQVCVYEKRNYSEELRYLSCVGVEDPLRPRVMDFGVFIADPNVVIPIDAIDDVVYAGADG